MGEDTNQGGRPELTQEQIDDVLSKLEPYLKSGLSVRKALREAGVNSATFYRLMDRNDRFREQIDRFRQFVSVLLNNSIVRQLQGIIKRQNAGEKLTKDDADFLKWFATNSNLTREEFGERKDIGLYDPEVEVQRILGLIHDATSTKKEEGQE